jgi:hypothetical protein
LGSRSKLSIALVAIVLSALAASARPEPAFASRGMLVGMYDPSQSLLAPSRSFAAFANLRVQVLRMDLLWGQLVALKKPTHPGDPADPAYNWQPYDDFVKNAAKNHIQVLFTIYGTPAWANGGNKPNRAPKKMSNLRLFASAAAKRYSGRYKLSDGTTLPSVRKWMAWNEPNSPVFLRPQWTILGPHRIVPTAARTYAAICTAVWAGVHSTGVKETVACGGTDPHGNNRARGSRPSIAPLTFLSYLKRYGLSGRHFDVYAHHPYYSRPTESPTTMPKSKTAVTLANINVLIKQLTHEYGHKTLWITEYGYQTRPPDRHFGVSWAKQAKYLSQAYSIARRNPRIGLMTWFLLRDEKRLAGWQSGLETYGGKKKPAYYAFRRLPH